MFKEFSATLAKGIFLTFATIVLAFGVVREFDLMTFIAPDNLPLQVLTMIIFTGGMLAWTFTFFSGSKGLVQHAVALISAVIGLLATIGATVSDIWLREALVSKPEGLGNMVVWLVTAAAGITLLEVWIFHLSEPSVWAHIREGWAEHNLMEKVYSKTEKKVEQMSDALADELAEHRTNEVRARIRSQVKGKREAEPEQGSGTNVPALTAESKPAETVPAANNEELEKLRAEVARLSHFASAVSEKAGGMIGVKFDGNGSGPKP